MSPDIQWHVGEDAARETIAQTTSAQHPRRNKWVALLVVVFGVSLGVAYRSLPDAAPRPTPTSVPTVPPEPTRPAVPAALYQTIEREVSALADGDADAYFDLNTQPVKDDVEVQRKDFTAWGRPKDGSPLYTIVDFDLLTSSTTISNAWADIRQFRNGRYFRETRFYSGGNGRWLRNSRPDLSLWSGREENLQTPHFDVTYAVEDRDLISPTVRQLEEDYQALCRDLDCMSIGQELTFTLKMDTDDVSRTSLAYRVNGELRLPSPRVTGFFESGRAYSWNNSYAHSLLLQALAERVYGLTDFDRQGSAILWAGLVWAINRIDPFPAEIWSELGDSKQKPLLPLEKLWDVPDGQDSGQAMLQAFQLLPFIEQTYGASAVTQLLGSINSNSAKSLSDAIAQGLGVPFEEFDQKWQAWAKTNITDQ